MAPAPHRIASLAASSLQLHGGVPQLGLHPSRFEPPQPPQPPDSSLDLILFVSVQVFVARPETLARFCKVTDPVSGMENTHAGGVGGGTGPFRAE
jgi:hypothetical protein